MTIAIELLGLELYGFHGVLEHERRDGQRFLVDLELELGNETMAATDQIADTVDYRDVISLVSGVSDARAYSLLEAFAAALADALLERFPLERARVRVRKPEVKLALPVEHAAVVVERRSASPG